MMDEPTIEELKPGKTIRVYILATRYLDVTHNGWNVKISSPRGVSVCQNEPNSLTVHCRDPIEEDEL